MSKEAKEKTVDIYIADEATGKETRKMLAIPTAQNEYDVALTVFSKEKNNVIYRSSRLGSLIRTVDGFKTDVTANAEALIGLSYSLTRQGNTKEVLQRGKISIKPAASKEIELGKTGTNN